MLVNVFVIGQDRFDIAMPAKVASGLDDLRFKQIDISDYNIVVPDMLFMNQLYMLTHNLNIVTYKQAIHTRLNKKNNILCFPTAIGPEWFKRYRKHYRIITNSNILFLDDQEFLSHLFLTSFVKSKIPIQFSIEGFSVPPTADFLSSSQHPVPGRVYFIYRSRGDLK